MPFRRRAQGESASRVKAFLVGFIKNCEKRSRGTAVVDTLLSRFVCSRTERWRGVNATETGATQPSMPAICEGFPEERELSSQRQAGSSFSFFGNLNLRKGGLSNKRESPIYNCVSPPRSRRVC